jgi:drug/metabolite transporter (DMT)-like permease
MSTRFLAYIAMVTTAMLWGSNSVAARSLLDALSAPTLALWRWGVALLVLFPFVWRERDKMSAAFYKHPKLFFWLALTGFAPNALLSYYGLRGSTAIMMGLMNSTTPVAVLLIVAIWRKRFPRRLESIGMTLSLLGVLGILIRGDPHNLIRLAISHYDLLVLLGLLVWAVYSVSAMERPTEISLAAYTFLAGVLSMFMIAPWIVWDWWQNGATSLTLSEASLACYIALVPTLFAMLLFGFAIATVGPVQCGIFTHLVPVFAAIFATIFLGEHLHWYHGAGFVLIVGGAILGCRKPEMRIAAKARGEARGGASGKAS